MVKLVEKYVGDIDKEQYNLINSNTKKYVNDINFDYSTIKILRDRIYDIYVHNRKWYSNETSLTLNSEYLKFIINRQYFKTSVHINRDIIYKNRRNILKDDLFAIEHIYSFLKTNKIKYIGFIDWITDEPIKNFYIYEIL